MKQKVFLPILIFLIATSGAMSQDAADGFASVPGDGISTTTGGAGGSTVTGVSVSSSSTTIGIGGTSQLTALVSPANATDQNVSWSSSNSAIVTVNSSGLVTGVALGSATIIVTTDDGGFTDACDIMVTNITTITIQENETGIESFEGIITTHNSGYTGDGAIYTDIEAGNGIAWKICAPLGGPYTLQDSLL